MPVQHFLEKLLSVLNTEKNENGNGKHQKSIRFLKHSDIDTCEHEEIERQRLLHSISSISFYEPVGHVSAFLLSQTKLYFAISLSSICKWMSFYKLEAFNLNENNRKRQDDCEWWSGNRRLLIVEWKRLEKCFFSSLQDSKFDSTSLIVSTNKTTLFQMVVQSLGNASRSGFGLFYNRWCFTT